MNLDSFYFMKAEGEEGALVLQLRLYEVLREYLSHPTVFGEGFEEIEHHDAYLEFYHRLKTDVHK